MPATSAALAGSVAFASVDRDARPCRSTVTRFQLASTALTVTLKAVPAVRALGVPVLPVAVPGAAVSPGSRIWSFANAPALIVVAGLVLAVIAPFVTSVAVTVAVPAVFERDREGLRAGDECGVGRAASRSCRSSVIATVSVDVTRFQLASTALTVTVKACPRSARSACRSCRSRCPARRSRPAAGSAASRTRRR